MSKNEIPNFCNNLFNDLSEFKKIMEEDLRMLSETEFIDLEISEKVIARMLNVKQYIGKMYKNVKEKGINEIYELSNKSSKAYEEDQLWIEYQKNYKNYINEDGIPKNPTLN